MDLLAHAHHHLAMEPQPHQPQPHQPQHEEEPAEPAAKKQRSSRFADVPVLREAKLTNCTACQTCGHARRSQCPRQEGGGGCARLSQGAAQTQGEMCSCEICAAVDEVLGLDGKESRFSRMMAYRKKKGGAGQGQGIGASEQQTSSESAGGGQAVFSTVPLPGAPVVAAISELAAPSNAIQQAYGQSFWQPAQFYQSYYGVGSGADPLPQQAPAQGQMLGPTQVAQLQTAMSYFTHQQLQGQMGPGVPERAGEATPALGAEKQHAEVEEEKAPGEEPEGHLSSMGMGMVQGQTKEEPGSGDQGKPPVLMD